MQADTALECPQCGFGQPRVYRMDFATGTGWALRADCAACGHYLKFVPKRPEWLRLAGQ
jgi:hypothetical protein